MPERFILHGKEYLLETLSSASQTSFERLAFCDQMVKQLEANKSLLSRARNGYIEDIKTEIIQKTSGVNLNLLFSED